MVAGFIGDTSVFIAAEQGRTSVATLPEPGVGVRRASGDQVALVRRRATMDEALRCVAAL